MMRLTFGRQHFTLSDNDALFVAEAILLQRKQPDIALPEHRSDKHGVIRLASSLAEPRLIPRRDRCRLTDARQPIPATTSLPTVDHYAID